MPRPDWDYITRPRLAQSEPPPETMIYTTVKEKQNIRIVKLLADTIMFDNYEEIFNKIKQNITEDYNFIVLDMGRVTFMDSLSLGMLVPLLLYTRRMGGNMAVVNLDENIRKLFRMLNLDRIIQVFGGEDEAVAALLKEGGEF